MNKTNNTVHQDFMRVALGLARRGLGTTAPNPSVGCVLVRPDLNGRIVGRGWTKPGGRPHAETEALARAGDLANGATAYVTLEPCCHHGQTPPCTDALIAANVAQVVVATTDPDTRVAGKGIAALRQSGLVVEVGILEYEARTVNAGFINRVTQDRPFVTLKTATSLDGRIATATGESQWITGEAARAYGHLLRSRHDAILTGMGTVRADNPSLTCRLPGLEHRSPIRIVLDPRLEISWDCALITTASDCETWLISGEGNDDLFSDHPGVTVVRTDLNENGMVNIKKALAILADRGVNSVLVEAGAKINAAFLKSRLVDEICWFRAPKIIGGDGLSGLEGVCVDQMSDAPGFVRKSAFSLGPDRVETYIANTTQ